MSILNEVFHWIGIDDSADKWTIARLRGNEDRPATEFEVVPDEKGYRKVLPPESKTRRPLYPGLAPEAFFRRSAAGTESLV